MDQLAFRGPEGNAASEDGRYMGQALAYLNDRGVPFTEIAAIIRRDPSVYFKEPR